MRAFWNYFFKVNLFNIGISLLFSLVNGVVWFPVMVCTFGLAGGIFAFNYFYKYQYYFYHNLGFTKVKLGIMVFSLNCVISVPLLILVSFMF